MNDYQLMIVFGVLVPLILFCGLVDLISYRDRKRDGGEK